MEEEEEPVVENCSLPLYFNSTTLCCSRGVASILLVVVKGGGQGGCSGDVMPKYIFVFHIFLQKMPVTGSQKLWLIYAVLHRKYKALDTKLKDR